MAGIDQAVIIHRHVTGGDGDGGIMTCVDLAGPIHDRVAAGDGHESIIGRGVDQAGIVHSQTVADVHGRVIATGDRRGSIGS